MEQWTNTMLQHLSTVSDSKHNREWGTIHPRPPEHSCGLCEAESMVVDGWDSPAGKLREELRALCTTGLFASWHGCDQLVWHLRWRAEWWLVCAGSVSDGCATIDTLSRDCSAQLWPQKVVP